MSRINYALASFALGGCLANSQVKLPNLKDKLSPKPTSASTSAPSSAAGTVTGTVNGQTVLLTLCDRVSADPKSLGDVLPGNPTKTFAFKGTVTNVFGVLRFDPPAPVKNIGYKVNVTKNGSFADDRDIEWNTGGKTALFTFTMRPGEYDLEVVNKAQPDQVFIKDRFTVAADTVGERASGNIATGTGKLMVCKEVDDDWKCVGESTTWKASQPFNLYVVMPTTIGMNLTKWVTHRQKPDGTDGEFIDEQIQNVGDKSKRWATTEGFRLRPGTYTIYSIAATEAQTMEHSGNLKNYFAKTTLVVQ